MSEVLTNGTFTGSISGWSKWGGSSTTMFAYDATGASHDGGAAKAENVGAAYSTVRYSMYQSFSITNATDIDTATVDAWVQYNDAWPAANSEVSKSTVKFWVQLRDPDENWHTVKSQLYYFGSLTSVTFLSNKDVKTTIQNGGNGTWYFGVTCEIYRANLSTGWFAAWFDDLSLDIDYEAYDSTTETITLTDTSSESKSLSTSDTESITLSDVTSLAVSADPTYRYYYGTYNGKVYAEDSAYKSDDGTSIDSYFESKETDFAEEDMSVRGKFKTIYQIWLWYVDVSDSSATVTISVKADGGASWTSYTESIGGTGDNTIKYKAFDMIETGNSFKFRVEHDSSDNTFQWSSLEVMFLPGGEHFQ